MTSAPAPDKIELPAVDAAGETAMPWRTVVWNDPVNLMSYVVYVFRSYFGMPKGRAHTLMMQVHEEGRAIVSRGSRERMETDVIAMQSYGLWATLEQGE